MSRSNTEGGQLSDETISQIEEVLALFTDIPPEGLPIKKLYVKNGKLQIDYDDET